MSTEQRTVWKFGIDVSDVAAVDMPAGAIVVHAAAKPGWTGKLDIWAIVDPSARIEPRYFAIRGTGHPLGDVGSHLATVKDGPFVWHVFEPVTP